MPIFTQELLQDHLTVLDPSEFIKNNRYVEQGTNFFIIVYTIHICEASSSPAFSATPKIFSVTPDLRPPSIV